MSNRISVQWQAGEVILNLYKVVGLISQGGLGEVYKVRHLSWNRDLAVRCLQPKGVAEIGVDRLEQSINAWVNLGLHPHIVACHYIRWVDSSALVFTEFVEGDRLQSWISDRRLYQAGSAHALRYILDIAIQVAWALHEANEQGVTHQNITPENVLLTQSGIVKVTDFGLSPTKLTSAQATNPLWSWASCLLAMFTGQTQVGSDAARILAHYLSTEPAETQLPTMPTLIAQLLQRCFHEEPHQRPLSLQLVANELQAIYQQLSGEPYPRRLPDTVSQTADRLNHRALALWDLGKPTEAFQVWEQALASEPQHPDSIYNRGLLSWRSGKVVDDRVLLRQLTEAWADSQDWQVGYLLGLVHLERRDSEAAGKILEDIQTASQQDEAVVSTLSIAKQQLTAVEPLAQLSQGWATLSEGLRRYPVTSIAFSPNGYYAATGGTDRIVRLWQIETGRCICVFQGHQDVITSITFNATGSHILSSSRDRTVRIWDIVTTTYVGGLKGHRGPVQAIVFSPIGRYAVSAGEDKTVRYWDITTGRCLRTFRGHRTPVVSVAFSPDGQMVLSGSQDQVKLWEIETGRCLRTWEKFRSQIASVAYSPDGRLVAAADTSIVVLWDVATGQVVRTFEGHQLWIRTVMFSSDGQFLLSGGGDKLLKLWEVSTGRCLRTLEGHRSLVDTFTLSPDGHFALSIDAETAKVWWLGTAGYLAPLHLSQIQPTETLTASSAVYQQELTQAKAALERGDAATAAQHIRKARSQSGYSRGIEAVNIWLKLYPYLRRQTLNDIWELNTLKHHTDAVNAVAFSSDSHYALTGSSDTTLKLWDVQTGQCLRTLQEHDDRINAVAFNPNNSQVFSGSSDATVKLWDIQTGQCLRTLSGHFDSVNAVASSPDGLFLLSGSNDTMLKLWDITTGRCLRTLKGHSDRINTVQFSPDGSSAATGSSDMTLKQWDIATGRCLQTFQGHTESVNSIAFSPDGRYLLSGSSDATLKLWEVATGECLRTLKGHFAAVQSVAFNLNGRHALSSSSDSTIKLWDSVTGECLQTLEGHLTTVQSAVFSAESSYVLSGSADRTSHLWVLDWDLSQPLQDWDEGAKPYLETFLVLHTPRAASLPPQPSEQELVQSLSRRGAPEWNDADFDALIKTIGNAGYGWLRSSRVRRQLMAMTTEAIVKLAAEPSIGGTVSTTVSTTVFDTAFSTAFATTLGDTTTAKVVLTITEGSLKGQEFEFTDRTTWVVGRAKDCNLQLPNDKQHEKISRYHCKLIINPPMVRIQDLGSLHGTYVNGQMIGRRTVNQAPSETTRTNFPEHELADGDEINLGGKTVLQVRIEQSSVETATVPVATALGTSMMEQTVFIPRSQTASSNSENLGNGSVDRPNIEGYTLLQELGKGTLSVVYMAQNPQREVVALKTVKPKSKQSVLMEMLLPEIERLKALQHPNLVQLVDGGYANGTYFFAQEYCAGGSVADLIQRGERPSIDQAVAILFQVLDGLEYAHQQENQGSIHGSLKPANLLLAQHQGVQVAKISDYGLIPALERVGLDLSNSTTANALAFVPRQWATQSNNTKPEIDLWSIAACFYTMLTGTSPRDFSGKNPYLTLLQTDPVPVRQRNPQISNSLAEFVDTALSDQHQLSFTSVSAFRTALNNAL